MHRFYVPAELLQAEEARLPAGVAAQITRVLRLRPGAALTLFCGDGFQQEAVIQEAGPSGVTVRLMERSAPEVELPCGLHVAVAVLKGEKLDWTVQKVTELGARRISLLRTERTIVSAAEERWPRRLERYRRIAGEAAEQSGRVRVPEILELRRLEAALQGEEGTTRLILDPSAASPLLSLLDPCPESVMVLVGPEGGFTEGEVRAAVKGGAVRARLGRRILRAETAAATIVASAAEQTMS
jgi:16S rRNA (uracil1498-N3)-methyltransferase